MELGVQPTILGAAGENQRETNHTLPNVLSECADLIRPPRTSNVTGCVCAGVKPRAGGSKSVTAECLNLCRMRATMKVSNADVLIWDGYGPSRTRGDFFDFEVGGHDGAYKGRVHVILPFIGSKTGILTAWQQSYNDVTKDLETILTEMFDGIVWRQLGKHYQVL